MKGIFISYRRQDAAGYAGRLYDRLAGHFGADRVFMDVEGIEPGLDFVDAIGRAVASCEVLIVIIGPAWLGTDNAGKRRLDDPKDFVRIETRAALQRHIRVVPVLVDKAVMPLAEQLPADLAPLARRQAIELSNKYWDATTAELIRTLERVLDGDKAAGAAKPSAASGPRPEPADQTLLVVRTRHVRRFWVIGGALAVVAVAAVLYVTYPWDDVLAPGADSGGTPPKTVAVQPPDTTASTEKPSAPSAERPAVAMAEKPSATPVEKPASTVAEKPAAPPAEKPSPPPSEKPAQPSIAKIDAPAASKGMDKAPTTKAAASEKTAAEKTAPAKAGPEKAPPAKTTPPKAAAPDPALAAKPQDDKIGATTPAQPVEKAAAPIAAAPATPSPMAPPVATAPALPASLPRLGDSWEYRMRSKWPTVQPRTFVHSVTAVSAREVTQAISLVASADGATARQTLTPNTRFVEWRGPGFYLLEFNPFLDAFGGLQNGAAITDLPPMPPENPMYGNWSTRGRVRGSESVTVPAGTFNALKVELDSTRAPIESAGGRSREPVRVILTLWYAPDVKRIAKMLRVVLTPEGSHLDEDTYELMKYRVQ